MPFDFPVPEDSAVKALDSIISYIEENGWYQGDFFGPGESVCILGAFIKCDNDGIATRATGPYAEALAAIADRIRPVSVTYWNDEPGRTKEEVLQMLQETRNECLMKTISS